MKTVIAFLFIVLCAWPIWGAPAISGVSGTISHGQNITIAGTGFGTHSDHNNLSDTWQGKDFLCFRWNDLEEATVDQNGFAAPAEGYCSINTETIHGGGIR